MKCKFLQFIVNDKPKYQLFHCKLKILYCFMVLTMEKTKQIEREYKCSLQTSKGFLFFISIEICYNIHDLMPVIVEVILRLYAYVR